MPTINSKLSSNAEKTYKSLSTWMSGLKSTGLDTVPLYNLFIPGSHDSGAYRLQPKLGFAVDRPDLRRSWFLNAFHFITYPLVARYSITQRLNIRQQLEAGVRYLDLRIALRPEDDQFYICHNFYGPRLEEILEQIADYVVQYPEEILVLDFQHVHNLRVDEDHDRLYELLLSHLRGHLVSTDVLDSGPPTLKSLWASGQSVFAFYRHPYQRSRPHLLWPSDQLPNPWANTRNPVELKTFLEVNITTRPEARLFITQGVLTPNSSYVVRHFFGSLESQLTLPANELLYELIIRERCGCDPNRDPFGPNIVMFDFVDWKYCRLIGDLVRSNRLLGTKKIQDGPASAV